MQNNNIDSIVKSYEMAKKTYLSFGIDTEKVMEDFNKIPISLHCWQGDDVRGFEGYDNVTSQNLVTWNYPGAARNGNELREDIDKAFSMSPCKHRVNLHSIYAEPNKKKDRNEVSIEDFSKWIGWAKNSDNGLDFNASFFTHEMMVDGFSLASRDKTVRDYWIKAGKGAREISEQIGKELKTACVNNIWIPDGLKDIPASRLTYRQYLKDSLDQIFEDKYDKKNVVDVLEGKLFGIGTESFTVGSHEFYLAYAAQNNVGVCMDTGHYHPTESVVDKISALSLLIDDLLLHISRDVRWDSDHVLIQCDDLTNIMLEIKRGGLFGKIAMGLDYFDASINRVAAWTIGLRAVGKAMLTALLEPTDMLEKAEATGDFTSRLALMDEFKNLPINSVWDMLCVKNNIPVSTSWINSLQRYEDTVQNKRK